VLEARRENFILAGFVLLSGMSRKGVCYNTHKENLLVRAHVEKADLKSFLSPKARSGENCCAPTEQPCFPGQM